MSVKQKLENLGFDTSNVSEDKYSLVIQEGIFKYVYPLVDVEEILEEKTPQGESLYEFLRPVRGYVA